MSRSTTIGVLLRHGSIQSVTAWDLWTDAPRPKVVANEYIKTMARRAVGARRGKLPQRALFGSAPGPRLLLMHGARTRVAVELDDGAA